MRLSVVLAVACLGCAGLAFAQNSQASIKQSTNIPAQALGSALQTLARERKFQIVYVWDELRSLSTLGAVGEFSSQEALAELLKGSGFTYKYLDEKTVTIVPLATQPAKEEKKESAGGKIGALTDAEPEVQETQSPSLRDRFRVAQSDAAGSVKESPGRSTTLEEVVVTAQKKEESALSVPMALTVLSGEQLSRSQLRQFDDYVGKVPGLTLINFGAIGTQLILRGLSAGANAVNSQVATYIDETPYTAVGGLSGATFLAPNLDTYDMGRIEVLKGPQGTLYGANALSGILKFVTNPPDPQAFAAKAEAGVNAVRHGDAGYDLHAMLNVPLSDRTALRMVGYQNSYGGYIDDDLRSKNDINGSRVTGGRAALLFAPTEDLSVRLNAVYQRRTWDDWSNIDVNPETLVPTYGELIKRGTISQPGHNNTQLYNATINWNLGSASLVSSTSYANFELREWQDLANQLGEIVSGIVGFPSGLA